jgi:hypothetical protein
LAEHAKQRAPAPRVKAKWWVDGRGHVRAEFEPDRRVNPDAGVWLFFLDPKGARLATTALLFCPDGSGFCFNESAGDHSPARVPRPPALGSRQSHPMPIARSRAGPSRAVDARRADMLPPSHSRPIPTTLEASRRGLNDAEILGRNGAATSWLERQQPESRLDLSRLRGLCGLQHG